MPSFINRSCQRQTQVFDLSVRRMISLVSTLSALERMIAARQASGIMPKRRYLHCASTWRLRNL